MDRREFLKTTGVAALSLGALLVPLHTNQLSADEIHIGVLYSTASGIILRIIHPDDNEHLDWLDANKPEGTTLYRVNKSAIMPGSNHAPNMDRIIAYTNGNPLLREGETHAVIDKRNKVVKVVLCCPVLYKAKIKKDKDKDSKKDYFLVKSKRSMIGDEYDPDLKKMKRKKVKKSGYMEVVIDD